MYPLFETIKILDGIPQHLFWHQVRLNDSFKRYFNEPDAPVLHNEIKVPGEYRKGIVKCRFLYSESGHRIEFSEYNSKKVSNLKLVNGDHIEYSMKYVDRLPINQLLNSRDQCDDH